MKRKTRDLFAEARSSSEYAEMMRLAIEAQEIEASMRFKNKSDYEKLAPEKRKFVLSELFN